MSLKPICAAVLAVATVSPATAAPFASSWLDLTTLTFSLEDTDTSDGVAAGFTSRFDSYFSWAFTARSEDAPSENFDFAETIDPAETLQTFAAGDTVIAEAAVGPSVATTLLSVEGPSETYGRTAATARYKLDFSGRGRFTIGVNYDIASGLGDSQTWRRLYAAAGIVASYGDGSVENPYEHLYAGEQATAAADGSIAARSGHVSLSFDVLDGQHFDVELLARSFTGPPIAAPVPEPSTWALMLAGLAGVVPLARRRRR